MSSALRVVSLALPVPFELGSVNVHFVEMDGGYLMIDAGHGTPACMAALETGLAEHKIAWKQIRRLFLTHSHPDHVGLVPEILDRTGARVLMHPAEALYTEEIAAAGRPPLFAEAMRVAGTPADLQAAMLHELGRNRADYRKVSDFQPMEGGERISVKTGVLEVVFTPGHSPGHLCLYSPEQRYLISGDHLLQKITPNIAWRPAEDMLGHYLNSLETAKALDVATVIPSHGKPFEGHRKLVDHLTFHHEERGKLILSFLKEEPFTAHGLVGRMWPKGLPAVHHHFAAMEVLAHLEYLRRRSPVTADLELDGSLRWRL
jgi:glyoxylase-like metal-dependent hydrolase (beta-lactamase superfamily II)